MKKTIVFTGGGTLGHVMPNLYLMEELKADYDIFYIGSNGVEREVASKVADYFPIPAIKLVRGKIFVNLKIPFVLVKSIFAAKKVLKNIQPDVVFSKGGYVALPVCIAAKMLKIPIIAHESDYSFGLANKIILKLCNIMCVNFKNLENKNKKIRYTGPIFSKEFETNANNSANKNSNSFSNINYANGKLNNANKVLANLNLNLDKNKPTMLVVGGSLGSQKINDVLLPIVKDLMPKFNIIHITGKGNLKLKSFENYNSLETCPNMANLYKQANFVLGRSGAGVTAECFYVKLPMLLIPLENKATRGDQLLNAKYYKNLGVAEIVHEDALTPTFLFSRINDFYKNIATYKAAYKTQPQINGRQKIVELINKYAKNKS